MTMKDAVKALFDKAGVAVPPEAAQADLIDIRIEGESAAVTFYRRRSPVNLVTLHREELAITSGPVAAAATK